MIKADKKHIIIIGPGFELAQCVEKEYPIIII